MSSEWFREMQEFVFAEVNFIGTHAWSAQMPMYCSSS